MVSRVHLSFLFLFFFVCFVLNFRRLFSFKWERRGGGLGYRNYSLCFLFWIDRSIVIIRPQ